LDIVGLAAPAGPAAATEEAASTAATIKDIDDLRIQNSPRVHE
jgi:hypothetical protein